MGFTIEFTPLAQKDFGKLPQEVRSRVLKKIEGLGNNPRPKGAKKLHLKGESELWRVRWGDYRVVYSIENDRLVIAIVRVGHRKDVYRRLN